MEKQGIDPTERYAKKPEEHPELAPPEPPAGFSYRDVWYDLSPMRPDEFGKQVAARWTRAEAIKRAFEKGMALERGSRAKDAERKAETEKRIEGLKAKMGG